MVALQQHVAQQGEGTPLVLTEMVAGDQVEGVRVSRSFS